MRKSLQLSVIRENLVTLSKEITYLKPFNTFFLTQSKTQKEVGLQGYFSEIKLATRDTFSEIKLAS